VRQTPDITEQATPLVVLACGQRCGSTLVQRLLCSHPRVMIWGEHVGQLRPVLTAVERLSTWTEFHGAMGRDELEASGYQGFIANVTPQRDRIDEAGRAFIETLFAKPAMGLRRPIWGFKEVRYGLPDVLLLRKLFARLRVIQIIRDPRDVLRSLEDWERHPGWTRRDTETSLQHWRTVAGSFLGCIAEPHLRSLILTVRYEDLIADTRCWSATIAEHCELDVEEFDHSVFDNRVHASGLYGPLDRELHEWSQLPASLRALADDEDIRKIASAYGYDLT
jgi:hypothetical protein